MKIYDAEEFSVKLTGVDLTPHQREIMRQQAMFETAYPDPLGDMPTEAYTIGYYKYEGRPTPEECGVWLSRVQFGPACPFQFQLSITQLMGVTRLEFRFSVKDRDDGHDSGLVFSEAVPPFIRDSDRFVEWVYQMARKVFLHELAECFYVDGKRVYDPHRHEIRNVKVKVRT